MGIRKNIIKNPIDSIKKMEYNTCDENTNANANENGGNMSTEKLTYSVAESAKMLGVSRSSLINRIAEGKVEVVRFGKRILIPRASIDALLKTTTD